MSEIRKSAKRSWGNSIKHGLAWGFLAFCLPRAFVSLQPELFIFYTLPETFYLAEACIFAFAILVGGFAGYHTRRKPLKAKVTPSPEPKSKADKPKPLLDLTEDTDKPVSAMAELDRVVTLIFKIGFVWGFIAFVLRVFGVLDQEYISREARLRDSLSILVVIVAVITCVIRQHRRQYS